MMPTITWHIPVILGVLGVSSPGAEISAQDVNGPRAAQQAASASEGERRGPLAALPSEPGPHIEKIKALGDNEWLELGPPEADPKWGRAFGRAWGGKAFALAPEIRGAYFAGEGAHAFVKPDGFGMDDMWVYDINAHRWICIHPGTDTRNFNQQVKDGDLRVNDQGHVVDRDGRLVPGHLIIHAWGFVTYDTDRGRFAIAADTPGFYRYFMPGGRKDIDEGLRQLEGQGLKDKQTKPHSPWFYDTRTGRFEREPTVNAFPTRGRVGGYPQFIYVPSRKEFFLAGNVGTAFYDPSKREWRRDVARGEGPRRGIDFGACHDTKRDRIYMGGPDGVREPTPETSFYIYDLKTDTWSKPNSKGKFPLKFSTNSASFHYDVANDVAVILHHGERTIHVYRPDANEWEEPIPMVGQERRASRNAFYDPVLNVHFVYAAGDSKDDGVMWAYRFARGPAPR